MMSKIFSKENRVTFLEQVENNPLDVLRSLQEERRSKLKLIHPLTFIMFIVSAVILVFGIVSFAFDGKSLFSLILLLALSFTSLVAAVTLRSLRAEEEEKYLRIEKELVKIERTEEELRYIETIEDTDEKRKLLDEILANLKKRETAKL